ncbi:unnamed protein product [Miscanthus lutarioriparius]|uniref:F-box domain-containing protein n=1 Tax=Miscanthus lutarioriparius TaxID=422564 RepID=A0A811RJ58_9POAL|nr:unnamed protein product [Miscanthus lutarioriparius]
MWVLVLLLTLVGGLVGLPGLAGRRLCMVAGWASTFMASGLGAARPVAVADRPDEAGEPSLPTARMASTSATYRTASAPAAQTVHPDEIWEEIFLRLDAAADLARASAACSSFRRIVSALCFLRRFRSLRSPAVLGLISSTRYQPFFPVEPPHRSAPEARALEQAADFTFSFLPDPSMWRFRHARDGRVLLCRRISTKIQFEDFVVCDPLHRRYVKIPRIPDDLLAFAADNGITRPVLPVLAPAGENDEEESFRVYLDCAAQRQRQGRGFHLPFLQPDVAR